MKNAKKQSVLLPLAPLLFGREIADWNRGVLDTAAELF